MECVRSSKGLVLGGQEFGGPPALPEVQEAGGLSGSNTSKSVQTKFDKHRDSPSECQDHVA